MENKKKLDKETALAKIKILINEFYENLGRDMIEEIDIERKELLEKIDDVLNDVELSQKHLLIEKLMGDNKSKELLGKG